MEIRCAQVSEGWLGSLCGVTGDRCALRRSLCAAPLVTPRPPNALQRPESERYGEVEPERASESPFNNHSRNHTVVNHCDRRRIQAKHLLLLPPPLPTQQRPVASPSSLLIHAIFDGVLTLVSDRTASSCSARASVRPSPPPARPGGSRESWTRSPVADARARASGRAATATTPASPPAACPTSPQTRQSPRASAAKNDTGHNDESIHPLSHSHLPALFPSFPHVFHSSPRSALVPASPVHPPSVIESEKSRDPQAPHLRDLLPRRPRQPVRSPQLPFPVT